MTDGLRRVADRLWPEVVRGPGREPASVAESKSATETEDAAGRDEETAGDDGVDDGDDGRPPGDVGEDQDEQRGEEHHAREHERDRDRGAAGTDTFQRPASPVVAGVLGLDVLDHTGSSRAWDSRTLKTGGDGTDDESVPDFGGDSDDTTANPTVVEYCVANVAGEARARVEALSCETRDYPCLERCGTCHGTPFLVVDGTVERGESHAALCGRLGGDSS